MTESGAPLPLPSGPFATSKIKCGGVGEREGDRWGTETDWPRPAGRCLWAIIYKVFNRVYFLALGNEYVFGSPRGPERHLSSIFLKDKEDNGHFEEGGGEE